MNPDKIIQRIRESYVHSVKVYTCGGCYQFHLILKEIFPQAVPWYDGNHIFTEIDDKFYDINGEVSLPEGSYMLLSEPRIEKEAADWQFDWGLV